MAAGKVALYNDVLSWFAVPGELINPDSFLLCTSSYIYVNGTFPDPDRVLNPLAREISQKMPGYPLYACALEPPAYLKFVLLSEDQWNRVYPNVKYTKELKYSTDSLDDPEGLAKKAVEKWSREMGGTETRRFGCNINEEAKGTYQIACLFK
ncbi:hypothetical protein Y032_0188g1150 [Ancylostoma ceylanicum]|nr:hypothetical protein Y032_0188g1150 [Ancylostoma ceylanicum]